MSSRKTFKFRLYPTPTQEQTLLFFLRRCRALYNTGLEERRAYYQMRHATLSCYTQLNELPDLKRAREFPSRLRDRDESAPLYGFRCSALLQQLIGNILANGDGKEGETS